MLVELPKLWIGIVNTIFFPVVMLSVAKFVTMLSLKQFHASNFLFKPRSWEKSLGIYEKFFRVRDWKHLLPDGSKILKNGFQKGNLQRNDPEYMRLFVLETCRGELAHWIDLILLPLVILWNPPWAIVVMFSLGLIGNLPCIIVQRYNRIRFINVVTRRSQH